MKCRNCGHIDHIGYCDKAMRCIDRDYKWECEYFDPVNVAEQIRRMTDEEMATFLNLFIRSESYESVLDLLHNNRIFIW